MGSQLINAHRRGFDGAGVTLSNPAEVLAGQLSNLAGRKVGETPLQIAQRNLPVPAVDPERETSAKPAGPRNPGQRERLDGRHQRATQQV
jgi:hypothetical protein